MHATKYHKVHVCVLVKTVPGGEAKAHGRQQELLRSPGLAWDIRTPLSGNWGFPGGLLPFREPLGKDIYRPPSSLCSGLGSALLGPLSLLLLLPPLLCDWEGALTLGPRSALQDGGVAVVSDAARQSCQETAQHGGQAGPSTVPCSGGQCGDLAPGSAQVPGGSARCAGPGAMWTSSSDVSWHVPSTPVLTFAPPP